MQRVFAFAVFAALLAGCAAGTSDDPGPPDADPNGSRSLPPVDQDTQTTGPPTQSSSNTTTTTAASTPTSAAPQPASFAPHDQEDTSTDAGFPSLMVSGRLQGSGSQLRVEASANNLGERSYRIPDGACMQPWSDTLHAPGGSAVAHRKPAATCQSFGLKEFPGHEFLSTGLTWDGTLWDPSSQTYTRAPPGTYQWEVTFDAYSGGTGASYDDHAALRLFFDVTVP